LSEFIMWFHFCRRLKRTTLYFLQNRKKRVSCNQIIIQSSLTPKEIKAKLNNVHSISAPAFVTVYNWMNLNMVIHPYVMHLIRDVQLRLLHQKWTIKSTILFWLIDEWKCASSLRPQTYHMTQWFQFCTNNWIWKNYRQDECRVCSLWNISVTV